MVPSPFRNAKCPRDGEGLTMVERPEPGNYVPTKVAGRAHVQMNNDAASSSVASRKFARQNVHYRTRLCLTANCSGELCSCRLPRFEYAPLYLQQCTESAHIFADCARRLTKFTQSRLSTTQCRQLGKRQTNV